MILIFIWFWCYSAHFPPSPLLYLRSCNPSSLYTTVLITCLQSIYLPHTLPPLNFTLSHTLLPSPVDPLTWTKLCWEDCQEELWSIYQIVSTEYIGILYDIYDYIKYWYILSFFSSLEFLIWFIWFSLILSPAALHYSILPFFLFFCIPPSPPTFLPLSIAPHPSPYPALPNSLSLFFFPLSLSLSHRRY